MALTPLSKWLNSQPDNIVAVQNGHKKSTRDFVSRVQFWINILRDRKGARWAVYHEDTFEFLAIVYALWQLDKTACIPGDNRPGTVQRLKNHVDGFVGEFPAETVTVDEEFNSIKESMNEIKPKEWVDLKHDFLALEIYTSGSTGEPKPIIKTISQLERELEVLELLWPSDVGSVVLATVSHQHLYGMTFRLFWPFSSGRAFEQKICEYPEDIIYQAKYYQSLSLVSSPSHLGRMNDSLDWPSLHCLHVISSAAPLAKKDSLKSTQLLRAPVREIYGSSETGAIAWRIQKDNDLDALWQPLPKVNLRSTSENTLEVQSPYLGTISSFVLLDRIEFNSEGAFKLLGRTDRIVKVEGKRVSLTMIENLLLENTNLVKNVKVITLEHYRVETAVVLQLTEEGSKQLKKQGRKALIKIFKENLVAHLEAVVLPRRWRFVDQMPYNKQGKLSLASLKTLFEKKPVIWPKIIQQENVDGVLTMGCYISTDLLYFEGHFDERPVLPGIVQVHWAQSFGRQFLQVAGSFIRLEVIKFQQIISPDCNLSITLKYDSATMKLTFKYESDKGVHSSGRICFE